MIGSIEQSNLHHTAIINTGYAFVAMIKINEMKIFLTVPIMTALVYFMGRYAATPYRLF